VEQQVIAQFADDTSLSIRAEQQSVVSTISTLSLFSQAFGLIINEEKSAAYWWHPKERNRPLWTLAFM
jgi:hypothetical protein